MNVFLNAIYEGNKDKICMPNSGKYTINKDKAEEYIQANCIEQSRDMLRFFIDNILYVTFDDFYLKLTNYIMEINRIHRGDDNDMIIKAYAILPDVYRNMQKSNFWVTLLIKKIIEDKKIDNFEIIGIIDNISDFPTNLDNNYIGIFSDDCAYSGQQSGDALFGRHIRMTNKVYVVIPYISNYAYAKYKLKVAYSYQGNFPNHIIFLEHCIHFIETFTELCVKNNFNMYEKDVHYFIETDEYKQVKSLVKDTLLLPECGVLAYFDHKVADQASTIQYFLNYSVILNNVNILTNRNSSEEQFNKFKNNYNRVNTEFFNKPISNISEEMKRSSYSSIDGAVTFYLGNKYDRMHYPKFPKEGDYIKYECNEVPKYYNIIDNCSKDEFFEVEDSSYITTLDLNKKGISCPNTFYKQEDFYSFDVPQRMMVPATGGKYYKKYLDTKREYLKRKGF